MTQNARVALWVPTVINNPGDGVQTTDFPRPDGAISTDWAAAAGGGADVPWADASETAAGTETLKAISPNTLRDELVREFSIPESSFLAATVTITTGTGVPADGNRLVKTNSMGFISGTVLPTIIDGGTY